MFKLSEKKYIPLSDVEIQYYVDDQFSTKHIHLACKSNEKCFVVAFKTLPSDSTGVAHILEHTVLCGSKKYPVRDPFFMMTRRSLSTFMNAFTASDFTAYPFSTLNDKDFKNLLSVYFLTVIIILISLKLFAETLLFISNNSETNLKLIGQVQVTDGDTIRQGKLKIRLHGIDAPEYKQKCKNSKNQLYACGVKSSAFLQSVINENDVYCEGRNKDRYGRLIAICYVNNINLNSTMVEDGWAIAYRYYSNDYIAEEERAKQNKRGIWQGDFDEPYIWRKNN